MFPEHLLIRAHRLIDGYRARGLKLAMAESCTGGLVAGLLTSISGSSDVVERGFVTYSNEAKSELIGVDKELIRAHGAVSEEVAMAMAKGAVEHSHADYSVAITGIAGPGGGTSTKPVGLVFIATAGKNTLASAKRFVFAVHDRQAIRLAAVEEAVSLLEEFVRT